MGSSFFGAVGNALRNWYRDRSGAIAPFAALLTTAIIGFGGLGIDTGLWHLRAHRTQTAVDAAALAGADALGSGRSNAEIMAAAKRDAGLNGIDPASVQVTVADDRLSVLVTATQTAPRLLSRLFLAGDAAFQKRATGGIAGNWICLLALDPDGVSLQLNGNGSIVGQECIIHVNSEHAQSVSASGNGSIQAKSICTVGGYSGSTRNFSPLPETGCAPMADPLSRIPAPPVGTTCLATGKTVTGTETLSPGVYCGGLTMTSRADVTLLGGTYIIKDGPLALSGQAQVQGDGVVFYLTGTDAVVNLGGGSTVRLTAPTSGDLTGVLFFEDRDAPIGRLHLFRGGADQVYEGSMYFSAGYVQQTGNSGGLSTSPYSVYIARRFLMTGGGSASAKADYKNSKVPPARGLVNGNGKGYLTE